MFFWWKNSKCPGTGNLNEEGIELFTGSYSVRHKPGGIRCRQECGKGRIIKEQIVTETIKRKHVAGEFLTFYTTVSDGDKEFILSLAEIEK